MEDWMPTGEAQDLYAVLHELFRVRPDRQMSESLADA
jgi:hypothetical protein